MPEAPEIHRYFLQSFSRHRGRIVRSLLLVFLFLFLKALYQQCNTGPAVGHHCMSLSAAVRGWAPCVWRCACALLSKLTLCKVTVIGNWGPDTSTYIWGTFWIRPLRHYPNMEWEGWRERERRGAAVADWLRGSVTITKGITCEWRTRRSRRDKHTFFHSVPHTHNPPQNNTAAQKEHIQL